MTTPLLMVIGSAWCANGLNPFKHLRLYIALFMYTRVFEPEFVSKFSCKPRSS